MVMYLNQQLADLQTYIKAVKWHPKINNNAKTLMTSLRTPQENT